jgi:hypothetical protein
VFARYQGGPYYFPGKVARLVGDKVHVHFDDGDQETIAVGMLRVMLGDNPWKVGDRVIAQWPPEPFFYPARVAAILDGTYVAVEYDDGDKAELLPVQARKLDLRVGDRVFARWQQGPEYFPGRIAEKSGDKIHVHYDDGEKEWSNVRLVRVLPQDLVRSEG